jgi:mannosyl-oligosaccharide alpha-1,2-mannosidase
MRSDDKRTTIADTGSFSLSFKYLSYLTNDPKYWNAAIRISKILAPKVMELGIIGEYVDTTTGAVSGTPRVGPGADSFYEYIAKQFIQTGMVENGFPPLWEAFMTKVRKTLSISSKNQFMFVDGGHGKTEHLDCFLGGTIALYAIQGARNGRSQKLTRKQLQDIDLAEELTRSCYELYSQTQTHLSPDIVNWHVFQGESSHLKHHQTPVGNDDIRRLYAEYTGTVSRLPLANNSLSGDFSLVDGRYIHRPETLESLFYMYRITGKQQYRDMGWRIFLAYEKYLKIDDSGYAGLVRCYNNIFRRT